MTLLSLFAAAINRYNERRRRAQALDELRALSPAQLRDIGVRLDGNRVLSIHDTAEADINTRPDSVPAAMEDSR